MPQVQARLDLPVVRKSGRKTGSKTEGSVEKKGGTRGRAQLILPVFENDTKRSRTRTPCRSSSRGRDIVASTKDRTPSKRQMPSEDCVGSEGSPAKSARVVQLASTPSSKENDLRNFVKVSSPTVNLARLSLTGQRSPLIPPQQLKSSPAKRSTVRANLFSPAKLTGEAIEDLLFSPAKSNTKLTRLPEASPTCRRSPPAASDKHSPVRKSVAAALFASPTKQSPVKPVTRRESPLKFNSVDELESLLCSPVKLPVPATKPLDFTSPDKSRPRSPRKQASPVKACPGTPRSNLFSSPRKADATRSPAKNLQSPAPPQSPAKTGNNGAANPAAALFKADLSKLQSARQALHTGTPSELVCRDEQVKALAKWLDQHLLKSRPGSLYVSGAPGTGKTATLTYLLANPQAIATNANSTVKNSKHKAIFINCMVLKSSTAIYMEVARQLGAKKPKNEKEATKFIEAELTSKGPMVLLVLDEVDQLESKNQEVLYTLFEWPALNNSRLALVGIANTLDLTDRVLPRLQVKDAYKPVLVNYPPYTKSQIIEIINKRLADSGVDSSVINPRAITFLAGKISSLSGDIRRALDVCRRAIEQAETSARKQTLLKPIIAGKGNVASGDSPLRSPSKGYKVARPLPQVGQVDLQHIMRVFNQVYGSKVTSGLNAGKSGGCGGGGIPTQQKMLLASLLLMVKRGHCKEVTMGKLVETYARVCKKRDMPVSDEGACVSMVQMLETRGMVSYVCKGAPRFAKVSLRLDEREVELAMEDKTLLASVIEDVSCIAK